MIGAMNRSRKVITAGSLVTLAGALVAGTLWLRDQGLDRASQWVTVAGFFVSTTVGLAGVVVAWLTLRQASEPAPPSERGAEAAERQRTINMRALASGQARVYQAGRDQDIRER